MSGRPCELACPPLCFLSLSGGSWRRLGRTWRLRPWSRNDNGGEHGPWTCACGPDAPVALFVRQALGLCKSVCGCERALAMILYSEARGYGPVQQRGHGKVKWVSCFLSMFFFSFLILLFVLVGCWCQQARKPGIMQASTPASKQASNDDTHKQSKKLLASTNAFIMY